MTKDELLSCLTDRPCEVCKFHTDRGCSKWSCVFEGKTEEWIPCEERLPEMDDDYLVTKKMFSWNCEESITIDIARFDDKGWHKADKILAWMPLPKPWKGEQNDNLHDDHKG